MTILVPIDPSDPSRAAVSVGALLARDLREPVLLLHVSPAPPPLSRLAELHGIAEPLRAEGLVVRLRTVQGEVVGRILERAAGGDVSWVVMGTRGGPLAKGPEGDSVAWHVLGAAAAPVVAVRPAAGGSGLTDGPLLVVAPPEDPRPAALAAALARSTRGRALAAEVQPGAPHVRVRGRGPAEARGPVILSFSEDCLRRGRCQGVIEQIPALVMIVGGRDPEGAPMPLRAAVRAAVGG